MYMCTVMHYLLLFIFITYASASLTPERRLCRCSDLKRLYTESSCCPSSQSQHIIDTSTLHFITFLKYSRDPFFENTRVNR